MAELIFVTGGSGFLASHVVSQLLEAGYRVRTTARGAKVAEVKERLSRFGDQLEVVNVSDIATDTFPLGGVDAIIHTASPLPGGGTPDQMLDSAINGSLNILRQAHAAGITRFVATGSIVTAITPESTYTDQDWSPIPIEAAKAGDPMVVYIISKTEAEKAIWAFGEKHPEMNITVIDPPFLYGPLAEGFPISENPSWGSISTDGHIYRLLSPEGHFPTLLGYLDVRDAAKVHVLALKGKNPEPGRKKRLIITSPHVLNFGEAVRLLEEKRPELRDRLLRAPAPVYAKDKTMGPLDLKRVEEVTGFKAKDYHSVESTILDTVDSLLELEKLWGPGNQ